MIGAAGKRVGDIEAAVRGAERTLCILEYLAHQFGLDARRDDTRYAGRALRKGGQRKHSAQDHCAQCQCRTPAPLSFAHVSPSDSPMTNHLALANGPTSGFGCVLAKSPSSAFTPRAMAAFS